MICFRCGHYSQADREMAREQGSDACGCACHTWAAYPPGWPACGCGAPALDGHLTCGQLACNEAAARDGAKVRSRNRAKIESRTIADGIADGTLTGK